MSAREQVSGKRLNSDPINKREPTSWGSCERLHQDWQLPTAQSLVTAAQDAAGTGAGAAVTRSHVTLCYSLIFSAPTALDTMKLDPYTPAVASDWCHCAGLARVVLRISNEVLTSLDFRSPPPCHRSWHVSIVKKGTSTVLVLAAIYLPLL